MQKKITTKTAGLFFLMLLIAPFFSLAQNKTVTGKVTNATNGNAISGASITTKGKSGVATNADGTFSISVSENAVLEVSSIGFETEQVSVRGISSINISLTPAEKKYEEVVVIGYGTANKRDLTGSIVKVSGKEVANRPNTNPVASLQGKVAGLSIVNSGEPGQEPDIRIRGTGSIANTKPLYVVDGIFNDNISYINPADIESMEILKDPSSLAIFGVRGANGVILISTKKGKQGKVVVNFNSSIGFKKIVDKVKVTDAAGFKLLFDEENKNEGNAPYGDYNLFTGNTNWQELIANKNAIINSNNVSVTSGTDKNKFYMSIGNIKEEGLIKHQTLDKIILNISDELRASKNVKVGFTMSGYNANLPQSFDFSGSLIATPIVVPFNDAKGVYNRMPELIGGPQIANPLMVVEETKNTSLPRERRIIGSVFGEVSFLKDFTFRASYQGDLSFNDGRSYTPIIKTYKAEDATVSGFGNYILTKVAQYKSNYNKFQQDYLLTYKKQFGSHSINAIAGFNTYFEDFSSISGTVKQLPTGDPIPNDKRWWYLNVFPFGDPSSKISNSSQYERSTASILFRALYNYKSKYFLNASFRRDGSSEISPSQRYDNFWALGGAWELTKETFMENVKYINFLKLKASVGKLGNQISNINYPYYPNYVAGASAVFGDIIVPAYQLAYRNYPNLKWETVNSYEIGVEVETFKRQLHLEANYYNKRTNDLLVFVTEGTERFYRNSGTIENKGVELSASWSSTLKNGIGYNISGNLTTIKNKVLSVFKPGYIIGEGSQSYTQEGYPIGSFFGWVQQGIYQSSADTAASPKAYYFDSKYGPGDIKYEDLNGDNKIDEKDRKIIGNPTPKFTYGFSVGANYKGFDLSMEIQGVSGNQIWRNFANGNTYAQFNYPIRSLERWHGDGTSNKEPRLGDIFPTNKVNSTYRMENGSYVRLRNIQLGYSFRPNILTKIHATALRLYVAAQNLKTWKHNSGFTPEAGGSPTAFGIDGGGYPIPAITTFGINVTF